MSEEGWYTDPYQVHEHRWFSDGSPTSLVRDKGKTSKDVPPDTPYIEEPVMVQAPRSMAADDLRRAGKSGDNTVDAVDAIWTYVSSLPT